MIRFENCDLSILPWLRLIYEHCWTFSNILRVWPGVYNNVVSMNFYTVNETCTSCQFTFFKWNDLFQWIAFSVNSRIWHFYQLLGKASRTWSVHCIKLICLHVWSHGNVYVIINRVIQSKLLCSYVSYVLMYVRVN